MGYKRKEEVKEGESESDGGTKGGECERGKDFYSWGKKTCDLVLIYKVTFEFKGEKLHFYLEKYF